MYKKVDNARNLNPHITKQTPIKRIHKIMLLLHNSTIYKFLEQCKFYQFRVKNITLFNVLDLRLLLEANSKQILNQEKLSHREKIFLITSSLLYKSIYTYSINMCLPLACNRRISRHAFRGHFEIAVGPVQETLPPLGKVLEYQTRWRRCCPVQRGSSGTGPIFHIKTANK